MHIRKLITMTLFMLSASTSWSHYAPTARPLIHENEKAHHGNHNVLSSVETQLLTQIDPQKRHEYYSTEGQGKLLTMIVARDGHYIAYMGQQALQVGDHVGQMIVTRITQHELTLTDAHSTVVLSLSQPTYVRSTPPHQHTNKRHIINAHHQQRRHP